MPQIRFDGKHFWVNRTWRFSEEYVRDVIQSCSDSIRTDPATREKIRAMMTQAGLHDLLG